MTQHTLQGRTESETRWFRRRSFMAKSWKAWRNWSASARPGSSPGARV